MFAFSLCLPCFGMFDRKRCSWEFVSNRVGSSKQAERNKVQTRKMHTDGQAVMCHGIRERRTQNAESECAWHLRCSRNFLLQLATFRLTIVVETTIEAKHSRVAMSQRAHFIGPVRISLSNRLPLLERWLVRKQISMPELVQHFGAARSLARAATLLGLDRHPSWWKALRGANAISERFPHSGEALLGQIDLRKVRSGKRVPGQVSADAPFKKRILESAFRVRSGTCVPVSAFRHPAKVGGSPARRHE